MKVTSERPDETAKFGDLDNGDALIFVLDGELWIKLSDGRVTSPSDGYVRDPIDPDTEVYPQPQAEIRW